MSDFFQALANPAIPFLRYALITGLLSSVAFGIIGSYVVVKRVSYLAGGITHSVLAGIGISLFLQAKYTVPWLSPTLGAVIAALAAALIIGFVNIYGKQREDTAISSIWAVGMAVGILFIARTPGYVEPMSYLFGNILIVSKQELVLIAFLDGFIVAVGILLYNQLLAVSFDEEYTRVRGIRANLYSMILILLTALTVVLLVMIVGIVMVIALLTIPAAVSGLFTKKLSSTMVLACLFTMVFIFFGMVISYAADFPSGSTIIVFAGGVYLLLIVLKKIFRK